MFFWKCPVWAVFLPWSLFCAAAVATAQENEADPVLFEPESFPIEYYRKRGLIPEENSLEARSRARERAARTGGAPTLTSATRTLTAPGTFDLNLSAVNRLSNERVIIANTGDVPIVNPWVVANNRRNWYSCTSIVQEAIGGETSPELKAFRIWDLVRRGRYHWSPPEAGLELHSPVKFLNVYGYGFCDDSATNLELLWKLAGLSQARCYGLEGHVVSEVLYGGKWHVLDADMEAFYPLWDGTGAASVAELASDFALVDRVTPIVAPFYVSKDDNTYYVGWWESSTNMAMTLRPDESLERCHYNWGKYHDNLYHQAPPYFGNGRQIWTPDLSSSGRSASGFSELTNVSWNVPPYGQTPLVYPTDPTGPATLVWTMKSAYLFVGGAVRFDLQLPDASSSAQIHFRKKGGVWQHLSTVPGPHSGWTSVSLDEAVAPLSSDACYSFDLRLTLLPGGSTETGLNGLSTIADIQCNPRSLPSLIAARSNPVSVSFSAAAGTELQVTFEWTEENGLPPYGVPTAPLVPGHGGQVNGTSPELVWESAHGGDPSLWREVWISLDANGHRPAAPFTWTAGPMGNSWTVPEGWLQVGKTYYWRVREGDTLSDWTSAWTFVTQQATPVTLTTWKVE